MSDTSYAPAPAPAAAPAPAPAAPAANEVPISQAPTNVPNPVGNQAPDKGPDQQRPVSRRDSIQKAFDKARTDNPPKAREAKIGDNNPPEETKVERREKAREQLAPVDLKKRPVDQPEQQQRERTEHGHFAPRAQTPSGAETGRTVGAGPPQPHKQLPPEAKFREPPQRMTERAKAEWATTPESVRGDVHRMHQEFGRAYEQYRGDHELVNTIRPFAKMAQEHGTTLHKALTNYTGMEQKLRSDVVGGLDVIINNLNLRTEEGHKLGLVDVAWHIVNQTPEQRQLLQSRNTAMAQSHQLQQAHQRIAALEQQGRQAQYAQAFVQTRVGVDQYAQSHPRLDELGDLIEQEVKLGFDLDTAYRRAEMLRPATAAQTRTNGTAAQTRTPTAQTRPTDRSISGAPSGGPSSGSTARHGKPVGRRDAIANAIKRVNGSL